MFTSWKFEKRTLFFRWGNRSVFPLRAFERENQHGIGDGAEGGHTMPIQAKEEGGCFCLSVGVFPLSFLAYFRSKFSPFPSLSLSLCLRHLG